MEGGVKTMADALASFISALTTGLSPETLVGLLVAIAPLILAVTIFAIVRRIINKNLSKAKSGGSGRV